MIIKLTVEMRSSRITLFLISFVLLATSISYGQFFVPPGQCPPGPDIRLDTFSYRPDQSYPFDRCFYLHVTLPDNPTLGYFAIIPIDAHGKKKVNRRDYRVFIRSSGVNWKKRYKIMTRADFNDPHNKLMRLIPVENPNGIGKGEYILKVPPLEPDRDYQIVILKNDAANLSSLLGVEDSLFSATSGDTIKMAVVRRAFTAYSKIQEKRKQPIQLREYNFLELTSQILDCSKKAPLPREVADIILDEDFSFELRKKYDKWPVDLFREYRFYLKPSGTTIPDSVLAKLDTSQYVSIKSVNGLSSVFVPGLISWLSTRNKRATDNSLINYHQAGTYQLISLAIDSIHVHHNDTNNIYFRNHPSHIIDSNLMFKNSPGIDTLLVQTSFIPDPQCDVANLRGYVEGKSSTDSILSVGALPCGGFTMPVLQLMMQAAIHCSSKDSLTIDITQPNDLTRTLSLLSNPPDTFISKLKMGLISLKTPFDLKKPADLANRVANINISINQVRLAREYVIKVQSLADLSRSPEINALLRSMDSLEVAMTMVNGYLVTLSKNITSRNTYFISNFNFLTPAPLSAGTSTVMDFVSANKLRIVPDFGFIGIFKGSKFGFQDMTPYLGFHINFRSIDKGIPMRNVVYKSWIHYLSFIGGITLRSMKIDGKREDFFGSYNMITGIGLRLNNYFKLTGGTLWFRRIDTNPLSTNKPLGVSAFAGLSIDLELQNLFGGITNLFK